MRMSFEKRLARFRELYRDYLELERELYGRPDQEIASLCANALYAYHDRKGTVIPMLNGEVPDDDDFSPAELAFRAYRAKERKLVEWHRELDALKIPGRAFSHRERCGRSIPSTYQEEREWRREFEARKEQRQQRKK